MSHLTDVRNAGGTAAMWQCTTTVCGNINKNEEKYQHCSINTYYRPDSPYHSIFPSSFVASPRLELLCHFTVNCSCLSARDISVVIKIIFIGTKRELQALKSVKV